MACNEEVLSSLSKEDMTAQIVLGNDVKFTGECTGSASFKLDTGENVYMDDMLYVPGLKKNLISVSALEDKGYTVGFSKGKVLVWEKDSSMSSAVVIGIRERGLYVFLGNPIQASDDDSTYELQYCRGCASRITKESHSKIHNEEQEAPPGVFSMFFSCLP